MSDLDLDALLNELDDEASALKVDESKTSEHEATPVAEATTVNKPTEKPESVLEKPESSEIQYSEDMLEVMEATRHYLSDLFDLESQIAELRNEIKARKEVAKEEGVKVGNAARAVKELLSEIKETSDEARGVAEVKRFIKEDDRLYNSVVAKTVK